MINNTMIAVVIPCYRVLNKIGAVLSRIPEYVDKVYIVDDCCTENSGEYIAERYKDPRFTVIYHEVNQGVGGAVITGYKQAISDNMDVLVKID